MQLANRMVWGVAMGCWLASGAAIAAEAVPSPQQRATAVLGTVASEGRVLRTLEALTTAHPARMTGTEEYEAAAHWAAQQLRDAGLRDVRLERFTVPHRWSSRKASASLRAPRSRTLAVESVPWSPSTPAGGIEAGLVVLTPAQLADFGQIGEEVRGRIVLASPRLVLAGASIGDGVLRVAQLHRRLASQGALALLWNSAQPNNVIKTLALVMVGAGRVEGLPAASLGMEDMLMLRGLAAQGPVRLRLTLDNEIGGAVQVANVIGELPGRARDGEWVLAGAHLDAWPRGSGANDNGVGVAAVIETARALAHDGVRPKRTVRFALWGGEEQGFLGSLAYVRAHAAELPDLVLALNYDAGAGKPQGWAFPGRQDLADAFAAAGGDVFARFGASGSDAKFECHADTVSFVLAGVPALDLMPDMTHYFDTHHLPSDTFEKLDPLHVASNAALFAAATALAAESPERLAPHRDAAEVRTWLEAEKQLGCGAWTEASRDRAAAAQASR
jgi:carboxypeptidase Q